MGSGGSYSRLLKVFLCHSSVDKPAVRTLYKALKDSGFNPWLDEEKLLPGQDWEHEIIKAVRGSDAVVVCLSKGSTTRAGYVHREIRFALDVAEEQPEGAIFLIPAKLEDCDMPNRLRRWQWVDLHETDGHERLVRSLERRARDIGIYETSPFRTETESLYNESITLESGSHVFFPCEFEQGWGINIDLHSDAPVDVLIRDEVSYQQLNNNITPDTLNQLLWKDYLETRQLRTYYHSNAWVTCLVIVRNQQEHKVEVQLKIDLQKNYLV